MFVGTILSFLFFTGLVAVITWFMTRKNKLDNNDGFFLAGRSLTFPFIAGSLLPYRSLHRADGRAQRRRVHRRAFRDGMGGRGGHRTGSDGSFLPAEISARRNHEPFRNTLNSGSTDRRN